MRVELEWGPVGAAVLARRCEAVVVVDVLSFSTCVSVAVGRGARVWPHRWADASAAERALSLGAVAAVPRGEPGLSLSPVTLLGLEPGARLLLPSPNGAAVTLAALGAGTAAAPGPAAAPGAAAAPGPAVYAGCLRNAAAVAVALAGAGSVGLVPAGERWPDGSLRPAYEDLVGAGAVAARLGGSLSPEAEAAVLAYEHLRPLAQCPSGAELVGKGFAADVELAEQQDSDAVAPRLAADEAYAAPPP